MKKIILMFAVGMLCLSALTGCNGKGKNSDAQNSQEEKIDIDDISFEPISLIEDEKRLVRLKITNNTEYCITEFRLKFKEKSNISDTQKENYCKSLQKDYSIKESDMDQVRNSKITISAKCNSQINPGETVENASCYYYNGYYYLNNIEYLDLCEPEIATISYVDGENIYKVNYDYTRDKYNLDRKVEKADQWPTEPLGKKVPKPKSKIIISKISNDDMFEVEAYGVKQEEFEAYVEECKKAGYTVDATTDEVRYYADKKDGHRVSIRYDDYDKTLEVTVNAPDKK